MNRLSTPILLFLLTLPFLILGCGNDTTGGPGVSFLARMDGAQQTPPITTTTAKGTGSFVLNAAKTELSFNITVAGLESTAFSGKMDGNQETPPVSTAATGTASFVLNAAKTELTFRITVTGLSGSITAARFYNAPVGSAGGSVRDITAEFIENTASGVWKNTDTAPLTSTLVAELQAGRIYVNVLTAANPNGEIRGQVDPVAIGAIGFTAKLDGAQETPLINPTATGTGAFTLNAAGTALTFQITVDGLTGPITAAHFHNAAAAKSGDIVRTLTTNFVESTASGVWRNTDAEPLSPALLAELRAGRIYVNVHTAAHETGEIRGQVNPIPITAAHFVNAAAGKSGNIVRTLTGDFTHNTASGVWRNTDSEPFNSLLVKELEEGRVYVNVHTVQNPNGEIRGQVDPIPADSGEFESTLNGAQETPAVNTPATGTGTFSLNSAKTDLTFQISSSNLSGPITAAHFHSTAGGGSIVRTLTTDFTNGIAVGIWTSTDDEPLSPALVAELEAGRLYVNIHTDLNPNGEIRGQVNPAKRSTGFTAKMDGAQETPAVITTASGTGVFALNADKTELTFDISVAGLSGPITQAHFHNAGTGVFGGIVRTLTAGFSANTASGIWKSTDGQPLTPALVNELEAGRLYVNVHTAANTSGEIRGQVFTNP